jgi:hypothetical protein
MRISTVYHFHDKPSHNSTQTMGNYMVRPRGHCSTGSHMIQLPRARKPSTSPGHMIRSRFTIQRNHVVQYNLDSANPYMTGLLLPSAESAGPCATRNFVIQAPVSYRFQSLTYLCRGSSRDMVFGGAKTPSRLASHDSHIRCSTAFQGVSIPPKTNSPPTYALRSRSLQDGIRVRITGAEQEV